MFLCKVNDINPPDMGGIISFIRGGIALSTDITEKIVVITGSNSGIGKAAAIKFAKEGYKVIMACRNMDISRKAQLEIIEQSKNYNVDLMELDISSLASIREFCSEYKNKYQKLDILIHNAACFNHSAKKYQLSCDNIELTFATNTVGPFLMTQLLTDMLKKSKDARILSACTTNIRHYFEPKRKIDFDNIQGEFVDSRPYSAYKMYGDSKIALLMLTFKMADSLRNHGIKVNAIQIPVVKMSKKTIKNLKSVWKIAAMIQNNFSSLPETMADTYFNICTSEEFKSVTGKLINHERKIVQSSHYNGSLIQEVKQFFDKEVYPKYADDVNNIEKVLELCIRLTKSN